MAATQKHDSILIDARPQPLAIDPGKTAVDRGRHAE